MLSFLTTGQLTNTLATRAVVGALALLTLLPGPALAQEERIARPTVPAKIAVPAGNVPYLAGHARGTQNYTCQAASGGYAWTLVAPDATLFDRHGKPIMTHYAGPTWQAKDGSKVVGARVDGETVSPTAIPWLLLKTASTSEGPRHGDRLTHTTFIQRINTTGGLAPTSGCTQATLGAARNVEYTADYVFYKATGSH